MPSKTMECDYPHKGISRQAVLLQWGENQNFLHHNTLQRQFIFRIFLENMEKSTL